MADTPQPALLRPATASSRLLWLQFVSIGWMLLELTVSACAAWQAHSAVLLAFGADSLVEVLSALVVLLQFSPRFPIAPRQATRAVGMLLFCLAGVVALASLASLCLRVHPAASAAGIAISLAALVAMPVLATLKRREAQRTGDRALAADAVQSATCAYLAALTLLGLGLNAALHIPWIDSAAALAGVPLLIREGRSALQGHACGCC